MDLISFTKISNGKEIFINPDKVAYLEPGSEVNTTLICFSARKDDFEKVKGEISEVTTRLKG